MALYQISVTWIVHEASARMDTFVGSSFIQYTDHSVILNLTAHLNVPEYHA